MGPIPRTTGLQADEQRQPNLRDLGDRELIELCIAKGADTELAWEEIVRRYRRKVFGIAYKFTGRYEESQDPRRRSSSGSSVRSTSSTGTRTSEPGCYSVSRNHCIDHYRSGRREREMLVQHEVQLEELASGRFDPHRRIEVRDKREMLLAALSSLPKKLREAVVLRDIKGLSYRRSWTT